MNRIATSSVQTEPVSAEYLITVYNTLTDSQKEIVWNAFNQERKTLKRKRDHYIEIFKRTNNYAETTRELKEKFSIKVDESNIQRWVKNGIEANELKQILKKPKLSSVRGRKYTEMETKLSEWFKEKKMSKISVSMKMFIDQAKKIFNDLKTEFEKTHDQKLQKYSIDTFSASHGWFQRYRKREKIVRRIPIHCASQLSEAYACDIAKFIGRVRELRMQVEYYKKFGLGKKLLLVNMDETPIYDNLRRNSTYHFRGDKSIKVIRTNGHKKRVTVCLAVLSDGRKLPPFVIFKRKSPPTNPLTKYFVVRSNANGWITEKLMLYWINEVFRKENILKLWLLDRCSSHLKQNVVDKIKESDHLDFIPAGCTSLVQPLDIMINKPFKDKLRDLYENWVLEYGTSAKNRTAK